jgi:metal-responsive CopG/Arc/MetJ family transcriptional regulator
MSSVRINISLPRNLYNEISEAIEPRRRSRFIAEAVKNRLKEQRGKKLAAEYEEASAEIRRINQELEGVITDGLD